eukprot:m.210250 g.210250  ORF g.210250 m.210250 type:complete len:194 (+) comp15050_c0_seq3:2141-2722(+)
MKISCMVGTQDMNIKSNPHQLKPNLSARLCPCVARAFQIFIPRFSTDFEILLSLSVKSISLFLTRATYPLIVCFNSWFSIQSTMAYTVVDLDALANGVNPPPMPYPGIMGETHGTVIDFSEWSGNQGNALIHLYRAEQGKMVAYRIRLDTTTNWAVSTTSVLSVLALSVRSTHIHSCMFTTCAIPWRQCGRAQ